MDRARTVVVVAVCLAALVGLWSERQAGAVEIREPKWVKPARRPAEAEPEVALKELKPYFTAVDLTKLFNSDAITDEADRTDSNFDAWRQSFAADELPKAGTLEPKGVKAVFLFPPKDAGKKNNIACRGQKIPLSSTAKALQLLVTATDGEQEEELKIEYADGEAKADLNVSDWCQKAQFGEKAAIVCPSRVAIDSEGKNILAKEGRETHIWVVTIPLDAKRELKSVKLPQCPSIHLFALTLAK